MPGRVPEGTRVPHTRAVPPSSVSSSPWAPALPLLSHRAAPAPSSLPSSPGSGRRRGCRGASTQQVPRGPGAGGGRGSQAPRGTLWWAFPPPPSPQPALSALQFACFGLTVRKAACARLCHRAPLPCSPGRISQGFSWLCLVARGALGIEGSATSSSRGPGAFPATDRKRGQSPWRGGQTRAHRKIKLCAPGPGALVTESPCSLDVGFGGCNERVGGGRYKARQVWGLGLAG